MESQSAEARSLPKLHPLQDLPLNLQNFPSPQLATIVSVTLQAILNIGNSRVPQTQSRANQLI